MKGFVCTGILYLPKAFFNGGWLFSSIAMFFSFGLTYWCCMRLMDIREKVGGSYSDIGYAAMGNPGKYLVDVALIVSQTGFVVAYVAFICTSLQSVVLAATG